MKYLLLFCLGLILLGEVAAQQVFYELDNPVDVIRSAKVNRELIYTYPRNKDSILTASILYDSLGNETEKKLTKAWGFAEGFTTHGYTYNTSGKILKMIEENKSNKTFQTAEFEYDEAGNETASYHYNKDTTSLHIRQKKYNSSNQLIEETIKIDNNDAFVSRRYYYDDGHKLIKEEVLDPYKNITFSYIYEYDTLANKKTIYLDNVQGKKIESAVFYNDDNLCIKKLSAENGKSVTGMDELNETREFIYNPDKTLFEFNIYIDGRKRQTNRHYYFKN